MNDSPKIALFGGSFDPPHLAHLQIAAEAKELLQLDQVFFIPCRQSPHKENTAPVSGQDRVAMLQVATADLEWVQVSTMEVNRDGLSYSVDTVQAFRAERPDAQLFWLMGSDQWNVFDTWYQASQLAEYLEFIVFPRPDAPAPQGGKRAHMMQTRIDMSSSVIRDRISQGLSVAGMLDPAVEAFIREQGLYVTSKD
jgi:nicotinate-nucleotide adenylyltransferase